MTDGGWFGPYRAQRISELLEARDLHDAESLLAIQMDPGSAFVDRHIAEAVQAFQAAGLQDLAGRLEDWDRLADLESTEATLFHSWWASLRLAARDQFYDGGRGYFPDRVVEAGLLLNWGLSPESKVNAAQAAAEYSDIPWGEAHHLALDHPMAAIPVAGKLFRFGRSEIPRVGGPYSVNVAGFGGARPPYRTGYGPSQRHVVDMADVDGSGGFILPGGQSGYPNNAHSFDQLELWREGRLWLLPLDRSLVEARTVATVRMEPGWSWPEPRLNEPSLHPQRHHRVHLRGPPGREEGGRHAGYEKDRRHGSEGQRIEGADPEEEPGEAPGHPQADPDPDDDADEGQNRPLANHHGHDVPPLGPQGDPDSHLPGPLGYGVGHDAVDPSQGQDQGDDGQDRHDLGHDEVTAQGQLDEIVHGHDVVGRNVGIHGADLGPDRFNHGLEWEPKPPRPSP